MTKPSTRIICVECGHIKFNTVSDKPYLTCPNSCLPLQRPPHDASEMLLVSCMESHAKGRFHSGNKTKLPDISKHTVQDLPFSDAESRNEELDERVPDGPADGACGEAMGL